MTNIEALAGLMGEGMFFKKRDVPNQGGVPIQKPAEAPKPDQGIHPEKMWDIRRHMPRPEKPQKQKTPKGGK